MIYLFIETDMSQFETNTKQKREAILFLLLLLLSLLRLLLSAWSAPLVLASPALCRRMPCTMGCKH